MVVPVFERQLHYVCGKGGVGKSVASCALALAFRAQRKRVLLVQVNTPDAHSRLLSCDPITRDLKEIEPGFSVVDAEPAAAMKEYALMTLKFEALYRTVFENRLTKVFLRFVPSLTELTIQGKIWHHAEQKQDDGEPRFERIVVDCPSTGHGVKFPRTARVINNASMVGPMAEKTRLMAAVVEDPARTALHVVALPEELPVNEARDLVDQVKRTNAAPLGVAFLNQRLPRLFDDNAAALHGRRLHHRRRRCGRRLARAARGRAAPPPARAARGLHARAHQSAGDAGGGAADVVVVGAARQRRGQSLRGHHRRRRSLPRRRRAMTANISVLDKPVLDAPPSASMRSAERTPNPTM